MADLEINVEELGGGAQCEENTAAFVNGQIYYAPMHYFDTLQRPKNFDEAPATLEELVEIAGDHTFLSGKGFTKINAHLEKNSLETAMIGPKTSHAFENKLSVGILGSKSKILGFIRYIKNHDCILLAEEFGSSQVRQIGSEKYAATLLEAVGKIEETVEGENMQNLVFQDKSLFPAAVYKGAITQQPAAV